MFNMLFSRILILSMAAILPLALSFSLCADPLAPKQAIWGIAGGLLLAVPPLIRLRSAPLIAALLLLAALLAVMHGTGFQPVLPWIIGAAIHLRARDSGLNFHPKYARFAAGIASLVALYAISQSGWNRFNTGITLVNPFGERVPGTLGNPTFLADYLAAFLPVTLALMALAPLNAGFLSWGAASLAVFSAIIISGSKGGQMAALAGTAGWCLIFLKIIPDRRRRILVPAAIGLLALATLALTPKSVMKSISRWTSSSDRFSFSQRLDILKGTAALISGSPLAGHGPGTFPVLFPGVAPARLTRDLGLTLSVNHAHNDFAEVASDLGLAGLILLIFILFRNLFPALRPDLGGGFALSTLSLGISMGTNFALFLPSSAFLVWMHSGLAARRNGGLPSRTASIPAILLALAGLYAGYSSLGVMLANAYQRPGGDFIDQGRGLDAESFLVKAAKINPMDRHLFQLLGRSREIQGKLGEAGIAYSSARALAPNQPITSFNVARIYRDIYLRSGKHDGIARTRSLEALRSTSRNAPYLAEAREWGGEMSMQSGDSLSAHQFLFSLPPDFSPLTPRLHRLRAVYWSGQGRPDLASLETGSAVLLESRQWVAQAEALMQEGRSRDAESLARKATRASPRLDAGWELLGYLLHTRGDISGARACYERLESIDPHSLAAQLNLLMISLRTRDPAGARLHLDKAGKIAPKSADVILGNARVLAFERKYDEARSEYRRLLSLFPGNDQARAELEALQSR